MSSHNSEMAEAVAFYRREMAANNRAFFEAKIDVLSRDTSLNKKKRLNKLATYFHMDKWPTSGHGSEVTTLQQLLIRPGKEVYVDLGLDSNGIVPSAPEQEQKDFLKELHGLLSEVVGGDEIDSPEEFAEFLTMTDGTGDPDYRQSGAPNLYATCSLLPLTRHSMSDYQPEQMEWYDAWWTVYAGWLSTYGNPVGATHLLYAENEKETPEEQELKWRVYTWQEKEYEGGMWLSSIAEYLRHRCQWFQRMPAGWESKFPKKGSYNN